MKYLFATLFFISSTLYAESCADFLKKTCKDHVSDPGKYAQCMKENKDNVPDECKDSIKKQAVDKLKGQFGF